MTDLHKYLIICDVDGTLTSGVTEYVPLLSASGKYMPKKEFCARDSEAAWLLQEAGARLCLVTCSDSRKDQVSAWAEGARIPLTQVHFATDGHREHTREQVIRDLVSENPEKVVCIVGDSDIDARMAKLFAHRFFVPTDGALSALEGADRLGNPAIVLASKGILMNVYGYLKEEV